MCPVNIMQVIQKGLRKGNKVKRSIWKTAYVDMTISGNLYMEGVDAVNVTVDDLLADDWEVIKHKGR